MPSNVAARDWVQDGEFERLGSSKTLKVDVRIVAATNRNLEEEVRMGLFRGDLYYRLNVFPITLPSLRARTEDIPLLVSFFLERLNKKLGKHVTTVPAGVMKGLQAYPWPGNGRELESIIERAVIVSPGSVLRLAEELVVPSTPQQTGAVPSRETDSSATVSLAEVEREHILQVPTDTKWRVEGKRGAAALLGLNSSTLRARMRKLGITR
jgi:formate hydrogenlyase transcriptional activator